MSITIRNIMKDGTIRDSMKGVVVPRNARTEVAYRMLSEYNARESEKEELKAEERRIS